MHVPRGSPCPLSKGSRGPATTKFLGPLCMPIQFELVTEFGVTTYSPGVIGFNLEQISNKLKISGSVQKNVRNNISKVP